MARSHVGVLFGEGRYGMEWWVVGEVEVLGFVEGWMDGLDCVGLVF